MAGFVLIAYCAGNIIGKREACECRCKPTDAYLGPQTFRHRDAPKYVPAQVTIVVCWGVCCLDLAFIYCYYRWQNSIKAAKRKESTYVKMKNQEWMDLTDKENPELVYELWFMLLISRSCWGMRGFHDWNTSTTPRDVELHYCLGKWMN